MPDKPKPIVFVLLSCCCLFAIASCQRAKRLNWNQIEHNYSRTKADSLYLQSAIFLRTNTDRQFIDRRIYRYQDHRIADDLSLDTISSYAGWLNVLEMNHLSVEQQRLPDTVLLTNDLIKDNIEKAVDTWRGLPPGSRCSWPLFLEYVLPYKILEEYSPNWRLKAIKQFQTAIYSLRKDDQFAIHIIDTINESVSRWFNFNVHHSPATWDELAAYKEGDCIAMSRLMAFAGRSYGLPVAIDFCPVWSNINGLKHYWNVLLQPHKAPLPFMGGEANAGKYNPFLLFETILPDGSNKSSYKRCAKVYRHQFSCGEKEIRQWIKNDDDIPYTFNDDHVADVTSEYFSVTAVSVNMPAYTTQKIAYLCVYNNGQWVPTAWDTVNHQQQAIFKNMAVRQLYMPAFFAKGFVIPWQYPFIADTSGIRYLQPGKKNRITLKIRFLSSVEQEQLELYSRVNTMSWNIFAAKQHALAVGENRSVVTNGKSYSLYYWDNGWVMLSTVKGANARAEFTHVPDNCLYKIVAEDSNNKERVFTYNNGKQQWW